MGSEVTVTFDTSVVKNENGTLKNMLLYPFSGKLPVATLATDFVSNTGSVQVTVPDNIVPGPYLIRSKSSYASV